MWKPLPVSLLPFYHSLFFSFLSPIPLFRTLHPLFYLHPSISLSVSSLTHLLSLLLFPSPVFCTHPAHPFFLLLIYSYVCAFYLSYWRSPVLHLEFFFSLRSPKAQSDSVGFTGAVYPEAVTNGGGSLLPGRRGPLRRRPQRHATGNYIFLCFCVSTFIV